MRTVFLIPVLIATSLFASDSIADGIYKWTDEDGNVHFEDRPSGNGGEELMQLTYRRTDSSAVQKRVESHQEKQLVRREAKAEADENKRIAAEEKAAAEERARQCEAHRNRLNLLMRGGRIFREDENGERVFLDDDERLESQQRARDRVKQFCDS